MFPLSLIKIQLCLCGLLTRCCRTDCDYLRLGGLSIKHAPSLGLKQIRVTGKYIWEWVGIPELTLRYACLQLRGKECLGRMLVFTILSYTTEADTVRSQKPSATA